jgi:hypothetical protein
MIKEEWKSSLEEPEAVKALTTKVRYQVFKLIDSAMALFDKHDTNFIRSSK